MNTKRWIALVVAAAVLGISLVINSAFAFLQSGFGESVDELMATTQSSLSEVVMEDGDSSEKAEHTSQEDTHSNPGAFRKSRTK